MGKIERLVLVLLPALIFGACSPKAEVDALVFEINPVAATEQPSPSPAVSPTPTASPQPQNLLDAERLDPETLMGLEHDGLLKTLAEQDDKYRNDRLMPGERYNYSLIRYYMDFTQGRAERAEPETIYEEYPLGIETQLDLNGDGSYETVVVTNTADGVKLQINDKELICPDLFNPAPNFAIVDIDKTDNWMELAISDFGPSSDDTTQYFAFDGTDIISMNEGCNDDMQCDPEYKEWRRGIIGGLYDYIECKSDGKIIASQRAAILQTWWYPVTYRLDEGHRLRIEPGIYAVDYPIFVLKPLELYTERNTASRSFMLETGQTARFTAHDDTEWVQVTLQDGRSVWFRVKNHNVIVTVGGDVHATDIFFYLSYAD